MKLITLDETCLVASSDTSIYVYSRKEWDHPTSIINHSLFNCMCLVLSTKFIIACDGNKDIIIWNKLDGSIFTTFSINKCTEIRSIHCGINNVLIIEFTTYAPQPSIFAYQVKLVIVIRKVTRIFPDNEQPKIV